MKDIENYIMNHAITHYNIELLSWTDAMEFVSLCEKKGITILGIDSFRLSNKYIIPFLEHSIDFTIREKRYTFEEIKNFLCTKRHLDLLFEIVF